MPICKLISTLILRQYPIDILCMYTAWQLLTTFMDVCWPVNITSGFVRPIPVKYLRKTNKLDM